MVITPPQMHINVQELLSAGKFPRSTVVDPGVQGLGVLGTQGIGVKTPKAAAVADATVGFAGEVHMPKGIMLVMGMLSMILASGVWVKTLFLGRTTSELGAAPKLHCNIAPMHTNRLIIITCLFALWIQNFDISSPNRYFPITVPQKNSLAVTIGSPAEPVEISQYS
jgi:hypothetical protein